MQQKIGSFIERRITLGNVATMIVFLVGWSVSGAVWYSQVQSHIRDHEAHRTTEEAQHLIDERVKLLTDKQIAEIQRRLENIEKNQEETLRVIYQIKGKVDKDR